MSDKENLFKNNLNLAYENKKLSDSLKIALESLKLIAESGENSIAQKTLDEIERRNNE